MAADDLLIVKESVLTEVDGENVYLNVGQIARAGHPIVKGREHLFEPIVVNYELEKPKTQEEETVQDVLNRVGDDKRLAKAALRHEQNQGDAARVTLIAALEQIIG